MNSSVVAGTERSTIRASHPDPLATSRANPFRHIIFALSLCLIWVLGGGCIFSPKRGGGTPPKDPVVYPPLNSPKNAVWFFQTAWSARDSTMIDSVYTDDYTGTSTDLTDTSPTTLDFVKSDEVRAVGAMALSQSIVRADMDLGPRENWDETHYLGDPPDWQTVQIRDFSIYVTDVIGEFRVKSTGSGETWVFEFTMRPDGPAGEQVWKIVRWVENRQKI